MTEPTPTDDGTTQEIENWLIIDWQDGSTRTRKSEPGPGDLGPRELATRLNLTVVVPDIEMPDLRARIEVPQPRVEAAEASDLEAEDVDDWRDVAREVLEAGDYTPDDADSAALDVIGRSPDRPDVQQVRRFVSRELRSIEGEV